MYMLSGRPWTGHAVALRAGCGLLPPLAMAVTPSTNPAVTAAAASKIGSLRLSILPPPQVEGPSEPGYVASMNWSDLRVKPLRSTDSSPPRPGERGRENFGRLVDLLERRRQRRHEANHRAAPSHTEEQAGITAGALRGRPGLRRRRSVVANELDTLQDAASAQVADNGVVGADLL